jgi:hypothetical protein
VEVFLGVVVLEAAEASVVAGVDMALWLIGEIHSPAHARAVQHYIQYDPAPPYQADV